ncbi:MAG: hypothetical protein IANPNBLG_02805 [Bryobacteraceae bacterium]|nr:hypothetical protein [Bryobacteraceae bacterium]
MPDFRQLRLESLRASQNSDGGWGYLPARQSWLEPTCYALLALYQDPASQPAWDRGWSLLRSWQLPGGGWRPAAAVQAPSWATALCVTLHCVRETFDSSFERGLQWLAGSIGSEGGLFERAVNAVWKLPVEYDRRWKGWPWSPHAASWVEPTAHSLLALKKASRIVSTGAVALRIDEGERMLLDRRTNDGGWNHGNRRVYNVDLPSYPETTGIALTGLQGCTRDSLDRSLDLAQKYWDETSSPLARAWLAISLRNYGRNLPAPDPAPPISDVMVTALEALACPDGGHQWLRVA